MAESREEPKVVNQDSSVSELDFKCEQRDAVFMEFIQAHKIYNIHKQKMIETKDKTPALRAKHQQLKKEMLKLDNQYQALERECQELMKCDEDE